MLVLARYNNADWWTRGETSNLYFAFRGVFECVVDLRRLHRETVLFQRDENFLLLFVDPEDIMCHL